MDELYLILRPKDDNRRGVGITPSFIKSGKLHPVRHYLIWHGERDGGAKTYINPAQRLKPRMSCVPTICFHIIVLLERKVPTVVYEKEKGTDVTHCCVGKQLKEDDTFLPPPPPSNLMRAVLIEGLECTTSVNALQKERDRPEPDHQIRRKLLRSNDMSVRFRSHAHIS